MRCLEMNIYVEYPSYCKKDTYQPILYAYLQEQSPEIKISEKRKAVIICPGGAYYFKSDREAEPIALRFLAAGMQSFVLQYSVQPNEYPAAFLELAEAVKEIRRNSKKWNIDPDKIMVCGFSAGGHVCGCLGTMWNTELIRTCISKDTNLVRPNGMLLCYPVISFGQYGHSDCIHNLLGRQLSDQMKRKVSLENQVTNLTVPTFLFSTQADDQVPIENSLMFLEELQKYHIPFEAHIYELGEHGIALSDTTTEDKETQVIPDNADWIQHAINWINRR